MARHWDVLAALQGALAALVPSCHLRKKLAVREGDTLPLLVIAPLPERIVKQAMNKSVWWGYPVVVGYAEPSNGALALSQAFIDTRQQVRDLLFSFTLPDAVQGVIDFDCSPKSLGEWPALDDNYHTFVLEATYTSTEARTS